MGLGYYLTENRCRFDEDVGDVKSEIRMTRAEMKIEMLIYDAEQELRKLEMN